MKEAKNSLQEKELKKSLIELVKEFKEKIPAGRQIKIKIIKCRCNGGQGYCEC